MATQTGSIDLTATNGVKLFAAAGFESAAETYEAKSDFQVAVDGITSRVSSVERGVEQASMALVPYLHAKNDSDFWYTAPGSACTLGSDGWAHYEFTNSTSSAASTYVGPKNWPLVIPGEPYTFLVEVKNFSGPTASTFAYMQQMEGAQLYGDTTEWTSGTANTYIKYADFVDGAYTLRFVKLADVAHLGPETTYDGMCFRYRIYLQPGTTSFDMRISVYPGRYFGDYNPYLASTTSSRITSAESSITQNATNIALKVDADGVIGAINLSSETAQIQASKVEIDGTAVFNAIKPSADATYDVIGAADAAAGAANSREQAIYRSAASGTVSMSGTTTWVTDVTGDQNKWTTVRPEYSSDYPVLFVATQRQTVSQSSGTTCTCTTPSIDKTTTVIDGWNIITGSVTASQIDATDLHVAAANVDGTLTAGQIDATGLSIGYSQLTNTPTIPTSTSDLTNDSGFQTSSQVASAVSTAVGGIQVGGRNLLRKTESLATSDVALTRSTVPEAGVIKVTPTGSSAYAKVKVDYLDWSEYGSGTYTASCEVRLADDAASSSYTQSSMAIYVGFSPANRVGNGFSSSYDRYSGKTVIPPEEGVPAKWTRVSMVFTLPDDYTGGTDAALVAGSQLSMEVYAAASRKPILCRRLKLEKGNKVTDWTPAPEDQTAYVDAVKVGGRNLLLDTGKAVELVTTSASGDYYTDYYLESDWGKSKTNGNTADVMCVSLDWEYTGTNGEMWVQVYGNIIANIQDTQGYGTRGAAYIDLTGGSGHYWAAFKLTSTQAGKDTQQIRLHVVGTTEGKPLTANATLTITNVKFEFGTKPTDWTPAPEDQSAYADGIVDSLADSMNQQFRTNAEADAEYREKLEQQIKTLMDNAEAVQNRTQALKFDTTDGLTISSKPMDEMESDFSINITGEGMKFRHRDGNRQDVLATASGAGFDAPHLIAGTDLKIGGHWQWQQDISGRLILIYV